MKKYLFLLFSLSSYLTAFTLPSKYVSIYGFMKGCDIPCENSIDPRHYIDPDQIKSGDTVWLQSFFVPIFSRECLPHIHVPFILVINWGDESFPTSHQNEIDIEEFIANENIIHIFAQNCDYTGPQLHKVSPLPIGIDIHTLTKGGGAFGETMLSAKEQESLLTNVACQLPPTHQRAKKALIDFHLHDTIANGWTSVNRYLAPGETRTSIAQKIAPSGVVNFLPNRIVRREFWKSRANYAFSICPPGNGLDTHRVWEDLILGCIVIVKSSPMDRLYEGLPVICIQDWSEINAANFDKWFDLYKDASQNAAYRERITLRYWMNKIKNCHQ